MSKKSPTEEGSPPTTQSSEPILLRVGENLSIIKKSGTLAKLQDSRERKKGEIHRRRVLLRRWKREAITYLTGKRMEKGRYKRSCRGAQLKRAILVEDS